MFAVRAAGAVVHERPTPSDRDNSGRRDRRRRRAENVTWREGVERAVRRWQRRNGVAAVALSQMRRQELAADSTGSRS